MTKKFIIKEAWILDESTNKEMKLNILSIDEIPIVDIEKIRGGYGNTINFMKVGEKCQFVIQ